MEFRCGSYRLPLGKKTYIMGILNLTPDSFSDGGDYFALERAIARAEEIEAEGAHLLDIGAQSTRPGSLTLTEKEETDRLLPVLEALQGKLAIPISVDTFFPGTAAAALKCGASVINDVTGFENPTMVRLVARRDCGCILMHPGKKSYPAGVVREVRDYLLKGAARLKMAGIPAERICVDPGIGFGTTMEECLELLRNTHRLRLPDCAYLVGASRKRVIGAAGKETDPKARMPGTVAAHTAVQLGGADILRVHDVAAAVQAARVTDAIKFGLSD